MEMMRTIDSSNRRGRANELPSPASRELLFRRLRFFFFFFFFLFFFFFFIFLVLRRVLANRSFEIPDRFSQAGSEIRQFFRAENEQSDNAYDNQLGKP